jgi:glycosyltransferase involved in cell wall biosynthesis
MAHVREVCAAVDLFLSPSQFLRAQFLVFGLPPDKVLFSPNGYEVTVFRDEARRFPDCDSPLRFAFTGTIMPPKGVHVLIEAFRSVTAAEAQLTIYGAEVPYDGFPGYGRTLRELAAGCRHISFAGPYGPAEIGRILHEVDVLIVPSIWYENAPLTIQEAFMARIPLITADLGGMRELVHDGVNGLLFRPRDALDLRDKIMHLIRDPAMISRLGNAHPAVKTIETDALDMVERYESLRQR